MNLFQVIILAVVQGFAEFFPISSSGHLVILQKLFGVNNPPILFDILLHVGSLITILIYFRKNLLNLIEGIIKFENSAVKTVLFLLLASIPAGLAGIFFDRQVELAFNSLKIVGIGLLLTSLLLYITKYVKKNTKSIEELRFFDILFIGTMQAIAILPGVSRSGSTINSGLMRGLSRESAFTFSFYLSIPAILGALIFKIKDVSSFSSAEVSLSLIGMAISAVVGYLSLRMLEKIIKSASLFKFSLYCFILGLVIIFVG